MVIERFKQIQEGWGIQERVIGALVYRELKTRVSQVRFGVAGVFIEPLGTLTVFMVLFSVIRHNPAGIDSPLFLAPGAINFAVFTEIAIRALNAMNANESLFFYKPVKPVDTVISRTLVESGLYGIVYLVMLTGICLFKEETVIDNLPLLTTSYVALSLTAMGLGLIFMTAGHRYPSLLQFLPIAMRPLWFLSGAFYSTLQMPQWLQPWLTWNPVLQATELSRHAMSPDYRIPDSISLSYLLGLAASICCMGLWIYRNNERILLTR